MDYQQKINEWFTKTPKEKILGINLIIEDSLKELLNVTKNEEFCAAIEGEFVKFSSGVINFEETMIDTEKEYLFYKIKKEDIGSIKRIVEKTLKETTSLLQEKSKNNNTEQEKLDTQNKTPTTSFVLNKLNEPFTTPTTVAPLKRTYDSNGPVSTQPPKAPTTKPTIDPYREIPEK